MKFVFCRVFFALSGLLIACAPVPMKESDWKSLVSEHTARIAQKATCCEELEYLQYIPLKAGKAEFEISTSLPVRDFGEFRAPVLALEVEPRRATRQLELFSFSDRKRGLLKFDKLLFIRPSVLVLNESRKVMEAIVDPALCWGGKDGAGGAWVRVSLPEGARFLVIYPSVQKPVQVVDTRVLGRSSSELLGAAGQNVVEAVSEEKKSYFAEIRMGYEGLLGVELIESGRVPPGRCMLGS